MFTFIVHMCVCVCVFSSSNINMLQRIPRSTGENCAPDAIRHVRDECTAFERVITHQIHTGSAAASALKCEPSTAPVKSTLVRQPRAAPACRHRCPRTHTQQHDPGPAVDRPDDPPTRSQTNSIHTHTDAFSPCQRLQPCRPGPCPVASACVGAQL